MNDTPVTLPPGFASDGTRPMPTGSPSPRTTIGIVRVARFAASAAGSPDTAITSGRERDQLARDGVHEVRLPFRRLVDQLHACGLARSRSACSPSRKAWRSREGGSVTGVSSR